MTLDTSEVTRRLRKIAGPVCEQSGYDLVEVEYTSSPNGWIVRVYIDRPSDVPPQTTIGFKDCERLSRELSEVLDVEDPLPHTYSLEVSSPGIDRPLRSAAHFQRFAGQVAKISMNSVKNGRRNYKGTLVAVEPTGPEASKVVVEVDGEKHALPIADIASARLVPNWDQLMKQKNARN